VLVSQTQSSLIGIILFGTMQEYQQADCRQQECRQKGKG
jgi:hypothetical protein